MSGVHARRRLGALLAAAVVALLVVTVVVPAFDHAVRAITLPLDHQDIIRREARSKRLPPTLIAGVIYAESKFRPRASSAGALGLMQLLPQTAEAIAVRSGGSRFTVDDLATPEVNIAYGSYYLRLLVDHYHGSVSLALAAYNAGENNVDRWVAAASAAGHDLSVSDIPFSETRTYVRRVLDAQASYQSAYGANLDRG